jgi:hypothetical protein
VESKGNFKEIKKVENNTNYFCRYKFEKIKTKKIRVEFLSTNGINYVCIYDIRVYNV